MNSPEIAWFGALCDDDYEQLGVATPGLESSFAHCHDIVRTAEEEGFDSVLLPSGYHVGLDTTAMAAALAVTTSRIKLLMAVRVGENWPPQLARQIATLQHLAPGRLDINIISSEMAGEHVPSAERYRRTVEVMKILDDLGNARSTDFAGEFFQITAPAPRIAAPPRAPFYFGGLSEEARDTAAQMADVYLMWPDTEERVAELIGDLRARAAAYGRRVRFGYRVHVVVRETEREARAAAQYLVAALDDELGDRIRAKSLDAQSSGVARQGELRGGSSDEGYAEDILWTGIGRARSGCGAALVGSPEQILAKINRYQELGIEAFIFSGYPHVDECRRFGQLVLPRLSHGALR